jgi:hypothetical protein
VKKTGLLILVALAVVALSTSGCNMVSVDSVKVSSLGSYTGTTAATKAEAMTSVMAGIVEIYGPIMAISGSSSVNSELLKYAPALSLMEKFVPAATKAQIDAQVAQARTITPSTTKKDNNLSDDGKASYGVTYKDESLGVTGLVVNGDYSYDIAGYPYTSTVTYPVKITAKLSADFKTTMAAISGSVFNGGAANAAAKIDGNMGMASETADPTIKGTANAALSAGFSINADDANGIKAGKFLVTVKYSQSIDMDYTAANASDPTTLIKDLKLTITIDIYDNDNKKTNSFTFTQDDLTSAVSE